MSDTQVLGAFALITVAAVLLGRWLKGHSPADLYRDEKPTVLMWMEMTDEQKRALELSLVARVAPFKPRDPHAHSNLRPGYTKDYSDRSAS